MSDGIPATLSLLEGASLIRAGDPIDDGEYRFKHTLIQETAYAGLLRERRGEIHRQVAEAILRVNPEAAMYQPATLAFHYYRGGDDDRAFRFALRAGDLARRNYAHQEAVAHYDLALEMAPRLGAATLEAQVRVAFLGKGTALEISGRHEEAQQTHRAMETYARQHGNASLEAEALIRLATSAVVTSDRAVDVEAMLERAEALARQAGDRVILAKVMWNQGLRYRFRDPLRAGEFFTKALEIIRSPESAALPLESGVRETEAHVLIDLMVSGLTSGRRRMAIENGIQALAAFRELGNQAMAADALAGLSNLHLAGADFEAVRRFSGEGMAISKAIDNPWGLIYNGWADVQLDADRGDWEQAIEKGTHLLAYAERVPFIGFRLALNDVLTRVWIALGQPEKAAECAESMARLWQDSASETEGWHSWVQATLALSHLSFGEPNRAAPLLEPLREIPNGVVPAFQNYYYIGPVMAQFDLERGDFERGLTFASELVERFEVEGTDRFSSEMLYWRGRLHAGRKAWPQATNDLRRALDLLAGTGARAIQWPIHASLAEALEAAGDAAQASDHRREALAIVRSISDGLRREDLRSSFLSHGEVAGLSG